MKVKIKKLELAAIMPKYASSGAAGADLYNYKEDVLIPSGKTVAIKTGLSIEIPEGYVGLVFARSGLATKNGVAPANKVGVIDCDYRGELIVMLYNHSLDDYTVKTGERVAQLVVVPYLQCEFEEGDISSTERGINGFGSTGK